MNPTQIWANLGVEDVAKTEAFYTKLGFARNAGHGDGVSLTSFFFGDNKFVVHFFERNGLKESFGGEIADLSKGSEIMFTLWAETRQEVDAWVNEVLAAGGNIFTPVKEFGKNYYGFAFADPDGHKWNVFHM